ncbi:Ketosamine-3-kinase [Arthrobotrys entomopaga]|nr:Ketosamine-3-kinase [Arthrobotrys entomopaga]
MANWHSSFIADSRDSGWQRRDRLFAIALNIAQSEIRVTPLEESSGIAKFKVESFADQQIFVKKGRGADAKVMFEGEYESLKSINSIVPDLCPRPISHGVMGDGSYFLATEFIQYRGWDLRILQKSCRSSDSLAVKLAKLHSQSAPSDGKYGFPVVTCCGNTPQDNTYEDTWASFFVNRRLLPILSKCSENWGSLSDLTAHVRRTVPIANYLLSRLSSAAATPVVVHGDLWSGNQTRGSIPPRIATPTAVIYDPSACYAPAEYDHGIMTMFGSFDRDFWKEYESIVPRGEPVAEYEARVSLYKLYHTLNHLAIFGGSYDVSAIEIMDDLIRKYSRIVIRSSQSGVRDSSQ